MKQKLKHISTIIAIKGTLITMRLNHKKNKQPQ